jgi:nucleoside-diphosphate-sugar epimerase
LCRSFRTARRYFLPIDVIASPTENIFACDLTSREHVGRLFDPIRTVIHLAGSLPSAFLGDPMAGAAVNLCGTIYLLEAALLR